MLQLLMWHVHPHRFFLMNVVFSRDICRRRLQRGALSQPRHFFKVDHDCTASTFVPKYVAPFIIAVDDSIRSECFRKSPSFSVEESIVMFMKF